jgi:hypothetical protein
MMVPMPQHQPPRRHLLKLAAGGAAAVGAVGVASRLGLIPSADEESPAGVPKLNLSADGSSGVGALDLALGADLLTTIGTNLWRTPPLPTSTHSMVGLTWDRKGKDPHVEIRSRIKGAWRGWRKLPLLHDLPDPDSSEATRTAGTELVWIGPTDGVQVRLAGRRPENLTLVLLHPIRQPGDASATSSRRTTATSQVTVRTGETASVPRPVILSRKQWGADESWRDGSPRYCPTIEQTHVHHTVNSNDYSQADVPALLRGIYRYHTKNLGWSDIAYNFLVDRFGRVWTGRAGGAARPVRGAHTLGFNATSTGISAIGNFELVAPTAEMVEAIVAVAAWKLDLYDRDPEGRISVRSEGSDKYRANQMVDLPVLDGHRDTNDTACPGKHLYAQLPAIRSAAKARIDEVHAAAVITTPFELEGETVVGQALTVGSGAYTPPDAVPTYTWMREGVVVPEATTPTYPITTADIGALLSVRVDVAKPGSATASQTLAAEDRVKAQAVVRVKAAGRRGKAIVHVTTGAEGLSGYPDGEVTIKLADRRKVVTLRKGRATAHFLKVPAGDYKAIARYDGSDTCAGDRGTDDVTVK